MAYQIIPPDGTITTSDQNFRNLQQSIQQGVWAPTGTSLTVSGTGLSTQAYYRGAISGITFFNITWAVTSGNVSWSLLNGGNILLPRPLKQLGTSATLNFPTCIASVITATGVVAGNLIIENSGKNGYLVNNSGATITASSSYVSIQGFYFTDK